jgi:vancomycin resistance protein VanJ
MKPPTNLNHRRFRLLHSLWRLFLSAIGLYAVLILLYLFLRMIFGDRLWPVALLSTFLHWALLPAFVLLPVALWARHWLTAGMLGINVAVFLWLFGGLFLPQQPVSIDSEALTVMTYNVAVNMVTPDALVATLRTSGADLIALQELSGEQTAAIEQDLHDLYPYRILYGYGVRGKGLLSRYPILEEELFYLEAQRLPYLRTIVAINDTRQRHDVIPVTVIVAHPPPPGIIQGRYRIHPYAASEIRSLAQMAITNGPIILMGDFNFVDQNDNYTLLSGRGLTDAFREVGWGFGTTWPAHNIWPLRLLVRIDYVWHSNHFRAIRAWIGPNAGSDHLPVLAELVWQAEIQD